MSISITRDSLRPDPRGISTSTPGKQGTPKKNSYAQNRERLCPNPKKRQIADAMGFAKCPENDDRAFQEYSAKRARTSESSKLLGKR